MPYSTQRSPNTSAENAKTRTKIIPAPRGLPAESFPSTANSLPPSRGSLFFRSFVNANVATKAKRTPTQYTSERSTPFIRLSIYSLRNFHLQHIIPYICGYGKSIVKFFGDSGILIFYSARFRDFIPQDFAISFRNIFSFHSERFIVVCRRQKMRHKLGGAEKDILLSHISTYGCKQVKEINYHQIFQYVGTNQSLNI